MITTIDVMRPGDSGGTYVLTTPPTLTSQGVFQTRASALRLSLQQIDRLLYSGTDLAFMTAQTIQMIAAETGPLCELEDDVRFSFLSFFEIAEFGRRNDSRGALIQRGDMVTQQLGGGAFSRQWRRRFHASVLELAAEMRIREQLHAVVCLDTPLLTLDAPKDNNGVPRLLRDADWMRYLVENGKLISTSFHVCPNPLGR